MFEFRLGIWIRNLVIAGVIAAFVLFFGPFSRSGGGGNAVARVGNERISRDVFEFFREQNASTLEGLLPDDLDADARRQLIDRRTLDGLIRRYVLSQEARALGLRATDEEVGDEIRSDEGFRVGGRFDRAIVERFASQIGGMRDYMEEVRRDLLIRKLQRVVGSPQRIPLAEAEERARRQGVEIRLRYARVPTADFAPAEGVTDDEAHALVVSDRERVEVLYQSRLPEFQTPEQVRARHILFQGEDAEERARGARARLDAGEEFAELARELSADLATREEGGDLGSFPRGRVLPELEEAAFALAAGEVSEPVATERGVHLVLVEEHRGGAERSFEEMQLELARELIAEDRAREAARAAAGDLLERVRAGEGFDDAARALGLAVEGTPRIAWNDPLPPQLARHPGLHGAVFALGEERRVLERILPSEGGFDVVWVEERLEPSQEEVSEEALRLQERLEQDARGRVLGRWYERRIGELQRSGGLELYPLYSTG
jgi:peptidyl-prolyl cis-trans isomerase D